jgi:hypothetical protein
LRTRLARVVVITLGLIGLAAAAGAQAPEPTAARSVEAAAIPHSTADIVIDGVLDDPIWREALSLQLVIETYPRENARPEVETTAYLVENGDQLLIAFDARDPDPSTIRAYLRDRDSAFNDDFVGVVLDTFNDQRRAFEFFVNPFGVQMDLIMDDVNRNESTSWDGIWDSAGVINGTGFTTEMAIPFSQLRFPRADGEQTWGIDVLRFRPREDRVRISNNPQDRNRNCYLCQFEKFTGFTNAEPGKAIEVVPTLTAARSDTRPVGATALQRGDFDYEAGLGLQWGITPDFTLDAAFNPDFSQVEADVAQLEENTTFALQYPETRPIFLEGADYYNSPLQAVFTRTVADPDVGAKFTGRTGKNTIGVFAANDTVTNLLFPGPFASQTHSLAQDNDVFVGRYSRGFGGTSTIGALVTSRQGDGYSNEVAGFDGRYDVNQQNILRFQYLDSRTEYPDTVTAAPFNQQRAIEGDAWRLDYRYGSRNWFGNYWHQELDPTFRADSGFITRVDLVQDRFEMSRTFYGDDDAWYTDWRIGMQGQRSETTDGELINRNVQPFISFQGPMQSFLRLGAGATKASWLGQVYDMQGGFIFGQVRPRSGLNINAEVVHGEAIDFANSRLADQRRVAPQVDWNATRHLLLRLRYTSDRLSLKNGPTIFHAHLTDLRLTWQFNVRSFVRLTLQDQDVERNLALYNADPDNDPNTPPVPLPPVRTKTFASQLLYSYKLNPQTVLFAGYSDNSFEDPTTREMEKTGRALFFKLSYAWMP